MSKIKAVIFDRDGTLNDGSHYYVTSKDQFRLLSNVEDGLAILRQNNITPYVFTQQSCIGKGELTEEGLSEIHNYMNKLLGDGAKIQAFYYCPHIEEDNCNCRKPKPGMLFDILSDTGLSTDEVLVVGDALRDYESAKAAGCKFAFIKNNYKPLTEDIYTKCNSPVYDDVLELAKSIV